MTPTILVVIFRFRKHKFEWVCRRSVVGIWWEFRRYFYEGVIGACLITFISLTNLFGFRFTLCNYFLEFNTFFFRYTFLQESPSFFLTALMTYSLLV